jgi:dTDP-4-dehydrorhamnose reductase
MRELAGKKILILGSDGQLARAFKEWMERSSIEHFTPAEAEADITNGQAISRILKETRADIVINGAAYNNVEQAEDDPRTAFAINAEAPGELAGACARENVKLVHFSSDYVFNGETRVPYTENDTPDPLNNYGRSKLEGERAVLAADPSALVLRLSWVTGHGKQNFLYKLEQWQKGRAVLEVADDETSVPTFVETIVEVTLKALSAGLCGLYHLTNSGRASRYEFAKEYIKLKGLPVRVDPVPMSRFPSKAARPKFTAMSNEKISRELGITIVDWRAALEDYVEKQKGLLLS